MKLPFNRVREITYALAGKNLSCKFRHFSFIIKDGIIVSIGINNNFKTHPLTKKYGYWEGVESLHSEMSSVIKYGIENCTDLIMINTRVNQESLKVLRNSKPCKGCKELIGSLNFKELWYSTDNDSFERLVVPPP